MRRLYRNRHATFIKTLLDQKKNKEELLNEKAEAEKIKKSGMQFDALFDIGGKGSEPEETE